MAVIESVLEIIRWSLNERAAWLASGNIERFAAYHAFRLSAWRAAYVLRRSE
jgi:hypothetical protein